MKFQKLFAVVSAAAMMVSLAACGGTSSSTPVSAAPEASTPAPAEKKVLRVGTSADFPPYEFHAMDDKGNDQIVGVDIELANYIGAQLGYEVEIVDMSFDGLVGGLKEGAFDMILSGFSITPERELECLFSQPYFGMAQVAITHKNNKDTYATAEALKGKAVGGLLGSVQEGLAKQYAGETAIILPNFQDSVMMLLEGKLDAVICETTVADTALAANPDLVVADAVIEMDTNNIAAAFQKDNTALRDEVNKVLDTVIAEKMVDKWLLEYQAKAQEMAA